MLNNENGSHEHFLTHWASSTGLTAVSKFKPRLPAQWAVGTHRIGPSRMEKVTSRMNWPIRNSTQIQIRIELVGNTIMWNPSLFFISNRFYKTQNNFGPLNDHIITEFSWVVTMTPAVPSTDILRWPVTSQLPSTRRLNCGVFAISVNKKLILGLCNMNQWWWWHRSLTLAYFGRNFVCFVIYLPISPQGRPRFELSYRVYLQQPVEFKIVRTEK